MTEHPAAVVVEITEPGDRKTDDTIGGSLILPRQVKINGMPVLTRGGVRIHEMQVGDGKELALVTITLPVRLLIIGAEGDVAPLPLPGREVRCRCPEGKHDHPA
jgi:hypothetical protein